MKLSVANAVKQHNKRHLEREKEINRLGALLVKGKVGALLEVMKLIALGVDRRKPGGMSTDPVQVPRPRLRQMAAEAVAEFEKEVGDEK